MKFAFDHDDDGVCVCSAMMMIMVNSAEFLANIFDLFRGIVHRMSKVVVLLHFADPSFFPYGHAHQKTDLGGNEEKGC